MECSIFHLSALFESVFFARDTCKLQKVSHDENDYENSTGRYIFVPSKNVGEEPIWQGHSQFAPFPSEENRFIIKAL